MTLDYATCILGLIGCLLTLIVGFIPPEEAVDFGAAGQFRIIFSLGIILMLLPAVLLYFWKVKHEHGKHSHEIK